MRALILLLALCFNQAILAAPVNVNTATSIEVANALTGIGEAKAMKITEHCQAVKCKQPEDLLQVNGIGEKTLEKIRADLRFED